MNLKDAVEKIQPLQDEAMEQARKRWDSIAKPLHSLGKLEDAITVIAGMTGNPRVDLKKRGLVIMCADNGIVEEGVTQSGQEITAIVAENFQKGMATVNSLCSKAGVDVFPVDIGVYRDTCIRNCKIAYGTKNFAKEPAMTREEAVAAIEAGIHMAEELKEQGYKILATGEMGIGNTTTSSAMASVMLNQPVEAMTGRGAGLSSEGLKRKISVIENAIALHQPDPEDAIDVLAKVGGFDIAGMAGVFLGGAALGIPVVIDGFISSVAALTAMRICPQAGDYILASHVSKEPAARLILDAMGKTAFLTCDMCLGEGTGAITLLPILDMAQTVYETMSTFEDTNIEAYQPLV